MIKVPYTNFKKQWIEEKQDIIKIITNVYNNSSYLIIFKPPRGMRNTLQKYHEHV